MGWARRWRNRGLRKKMIPLLLHPSSYRANKYYQAGERQTKFTLTAKIFSRLDSEICFPHAPDCGG